MFSWKFFKISNLAPSAVMPNELCVREWANSLNHRLINSGEISIFRKGVVSLKNSHPVTVSCDAQRKKMVLATFYRKERAAVSSTSSSGKSSKISARPIPGAHIYGTS